MTKKFFKLGFIRLFLILCFVQIAFVAFGQESDNEGFILPDLEIDAERFSYDGIGTRWQDRIDQQVLELKCSKDPVQLLKSLNSSVTVSHSLLGAIYTPELRGFDGKHTKVMLDGCSLNTPWGGSSSLSGFPLRRLKAAKIISGGQALVYGSNGLAGAVNLVLPTARDLEGLTFVQEVGGKGTRHQEFLYGHVGHQNEHLFGVFLDNYDGKRRYKTYGIGGNSMDNQMFMYKGRVETDNGWIFKATILKSEGNISVPNYMCRFEPWEMSHKDFVIEKDFENDSNLILRYATYRDYSATQLYSDYTLAVASGPIDPTDDVEIEKKNYEVIYNFPIGEKHYLSLGSQMEKIRDKGHTVKAKANNKWLDTKGIFISDSIAVSDRLNVHLAARKDESFESDSENAWAISSDYKLSNKSKFGFGVSKTVRFPNVQELYRGKRLYGNENLSPERSDNFELRLDHKFNKKWQASLTRFQSKVDDKITTTITSVAANIPGVGALKANDSYYINIDKAEIAGWELGLKGLISDKLETWASYTRLDRAEDETNNLRLVGKPEYRLTAGASYHFGKTRLMLTCEHQGNTKSTSTIDSSGKATNYAEVDSSTIFDLGLRKQITKDFSLYLNVENIFDKDDAVMVQASDLKNKFGLLTDPIYYRDGRRTTLGMEVKF